MDFSNVNLVAVLLCGVAAMVTGFIWYSLPVFGKAWMKLIGKSEKDLKEGAVPSLYLMSFVCALVMGYVLALIFNVASVTTIDAGLMMAFLVWLGFMAAPTLQNNLYEGKPNNLFLINAGYVLVTLLVMSVILTSL